MDFNSGSGPFEWPERRRDAKQQGGQHGNTSGERKHKTVRAEFELERREFGGIQRGEHARCGVRQQDPERCSARARDEAFQEYLPREPGPGNAQRYPDREFPAVLIPGDVYLLCTDGLTERLSAPRIAELLRRPAREACAALVDEAYQNGGRDNITCVVLAVRAAAK